MEAMRGDSVYTALEAKYGFGADANTSEQTLRTRSSFQQPQFVAMDGMPGSSPDNPYGTRQGSNWQVVTNGITWYWAPVDQITTGPQHQSQDILNEIYPMIPAQWGQGWPYNVKVVETQGTSKAGCGPVAMAQIMAYHRKPTGYMWNDYGFNLLENIDRDRNYAWSWEAKQNSVIQNIGQLLLDIGKTADADYAPTGTGLWLGQAAVGFRKMGYACSDSIPYNALKVENNLRENMPVYMSGVRSGGGHAWVVDGLAQRVDFTTVEKYCAYQGESVGYIPVRTINFQFGQKYYHINWGWNGLDNGWYLVGAFNPPSHGDYDRDLRMLTDIK